jgi:hypothetical protein
MNKIIFTNTQDVSQDFYPKPSSLSIPDWYKTLNSYKGDKKVPAGNGVTSATIKRCMPVFDLITAGYILYTYTDIYISQKIVFDDSLDKGDTPKTEPWYEWSSHNPIGFHTVEQAPNHPNRNGLNSYPKWINPWGIKTAKGYSTLFTQPFHRESPFTILPAIVDTDKYTAPVNFPFVLNDASFEGFIPAGTPMAQAIPFKRESWKMEIGSKKDFNEQEAVTSKLRTKFFDSYKTQFRQNKEYK